MLSASTQRNNNREMRYSPCILNPGTKSWVSSFTPRPLYLRWKSPPYPSSRTYCGPQGRFACFEYTETSSALPEQKVSSVFQTVLKSLYWATLTSSILRLAVIKYNRSMLLHSKTPSDISSAHKLVYNIPCKNYRTPVPWNREWWFMSPKEESPVKYVIHQ